MRSIPSTLASFLALPLATFACDSPDDTLSTSTDSSEQPVVSGSSAGDSEREPVKGETSGTGGADSTEEEEPLTGVSSRGDEGEDSSQSSGSDSGGMESGGSGGSVTTAAGGDMMMPAEELECVSHLPSDVDVEELIEQGDQEALDALEDLVVEVCLPAISCPVGEVEQFLLEPEAILHCIPCQEGLFNSQVNAKFCRSCGTCEGLGVSEACTAERNTLCNHTGYIEQFGTADHDIVRAIDVDATGNVWLAGSWATPQSGENSGAFIRKISQDGSEELIDAFGLGADQRALAIYVDPVGTVWAGGFTDGYLERPAQGTYDAFVRRYPADGSASLTEQFGGEDSEQVEIIVGDSIGNVWLIGDTNGPSFGEHLGSYDLFIREYPADGSAPTSIQFGGPGPDYVDAAVLDPDGNLWLSGSMFSTHVEDASGKYEPFLKKLLMDGTATTSLEISLPEGESVTTMAIDPSGSLWVAGYTGGPLGDLNEANHEIFVRKYLSDGTPDFSDQFGSPDGERVGALVSDAEGNVYLTGSAWCNFGDAELEKGSQSAAQQSDLADACSPLLPGLGYGDVFVRMYPANGSSALTVQRGTKNTDSAVAAAAAPSGGIWIAGTTSGILGDQGYGEIDSYAWHFLP